MNKSLDWRWYIVDRDKIKQETNYSESYATEAEAQKALKDVTTSEFNTSIKFVEFNNCISYEGSGYKGSLQIEYLPCRN